jgi:K+-transporting ATPase A subunit
MIQLGEVVFGGVGSGLYGMLISPSWPSSSQA